VENCKLDACFNIIHVYQSYGSSLQGVMLKTMFVICSSGNAKISEFIELDWQLTRGQGTFLVAISPTEVVWVAIFGIGMHNPGEFNNWLSWTVIPLGIFLLTN